MKEGVKIISRVKSGELWFCSGCNAYHLMFNNLFFAFTKKELIGFKNYVDKLEIGYWEHKYACSNLRRKIPIPTSQENLVIMLNRQEVIELQTLLAFKNASIKAYKTLNADDIDYECHLN